MSGYTDDPPFILENVENWAETDKAVLLGMTRKSAQWYPKSQTEDWPNPGFPGDATITSWIAKQKGLL